MLRLANVCAVLEDGVPPAHSEAILVGRPLDGSRNPKTMMGMKLANITGVVTYQVCTSAWLQDYMHLQ